MPDKVPLPIDDHLPALLEAARTHRALVLVAEPGAGKTTRVPPAIVQSGVLGNEHPNLVMLQPRRVAARAAAMRIAEENHWTVGQQVGYHVRFERRITRDTRLRVLTEGILIRQLVDDPFLEGVGCVVLDEFHERSIHTDLSLALLREIRETVRADLVLIVMSATLDAEPVARFLGDCPILRVPGRTHPVQINYSTSSAAPLPERVATAVDKVLASPGGDVLAFLPGVEEIRRTLHRLEPIAARDDVMLLPLHGTLPLEEQIRAIRPADRRKVVLATNIAETSLTIEGVTAVIDSGLARVAGFDAQRGLDRLELKRISQASATQRAGRAGRTRPGTCLRLWTAKEQAALPPFELPEIRRVDLAATVLTLHAWGRADPRQFGWFEPPDESTLLAAERLLFMLGALSRESGGTITELGRRLMTLPVHPRLARLLVAAMDEHLPYSGATLAALLSEKDILLRTHPAEAPNRPMVQGTSDLLHRRDRLALAERSRFARSLRDEGVDPHAARQVARTRDELLRVIGRRDATDDRPDADEILERIVLLAYPDRVCRRRGADPMSGVMVGGRGVRLAAESVVKRAEFFLALDARSDDRARARQATVHIASAIDVQWLEDLFPDQIERRREAIFDEARERVVARSVVAYRDLVLREQSDAAVAPNEAAAVLVEALRPRARALFESDPAAALWLARLAFLRQFMPEQDWPALDDDALAHLLADHAGGRQSLEALAKLPLASILSNQLPYALKRLMDAEAPEAIEVPTGNRIRLDYVPGQPPVLAVRLQELFGWTDTPRLAGSRAPVRLHLLGPNYRPVQVTSDLRSFWTNTYPQVRKDLRARYPKHSWPEDPLNARPEAKGGRRRGG